MIAADQQRWYRDLVDRVRAEVRRTVPGDARVLVITRGDEALLMLDGRRGGHFPQTRTGLYAGHYPADGAEVVAHLDELRRAGASYLVIPATAVWWLDHYPELRTSLQERGSLISDDPETALIYELGRAQAATTIRMPDALEVARTAPPIGSLLRALLPDGAGVVLIGAAAEAIDLEDRPCWRLPGSPVEAVIEQTRAACGAGARFVVLLHPARPTERLDVGLRHRLAGHLRPVCAQRLAEIFEVPGG